MKKAVHFGAGSIGRGFIGDLLHDTGYEIVLVDVDKNIVKYETLMRIEDINEKGEVVYLSPYFFLDISVKTKQYLQLSNQIISKALKDLKKTDKQISINLSFKDILDSEFIVFLDESIKRINNEDR